MLEIAVAICVFVVIMFICACRLSKFRHWSVSLDYCSINSRRYSIARCHSTGCCQDHPNGHSMLLSYYNIL